MVILTYIYHENQLNVGEYTVHGSSRYGIFTDMWLQCMVNCMYNILCQSHGSGNSKMTRDTWTILM